MKKIAVLMVIVLALPLLAACTGAEAAEPQYEAIVGGPLELTPEEIAEMQEAMIDPDTVQIIVNGEAIDAPKPFVESASGSVMIPIAAAAEALGYTVVDEGTEVVIGPGTLLVEGLNSYARGREAARELSTAPVIRDGVMFVPWEFFQEILVTSVAYMDSGNVIVDTIESDNE